MVQFRQPPRLCWHRSFYLSLRRELQGRVSSLEDRLRSERAILSCSSGVRHNAALAAIAEIEKEIARLVEEIEGISVPSGRETSRSDAGAETETTARG